jgi:hypothetical protein
MKFSALTKSPQAPRLLAIVTAIVFFGLPHLTAQATLYKCKDDSGRITYSDAPCRPPAPPKPKAATGAEASKSGQPPNAATPAAAQPVVPAAPAAPPEPPFNIAPSGKLTKELIANINRKSFSAFNQGDLQIGCTLAAPDLKFTQTDESVQPAMTVSGGKSELCAMLKQQAELFKATQMQVSSEPGKLDISISWFRPTGSLEYTSITSMEIQGRVMVKQRCTAKQNFAVYGDRVLVNEMKAVCKVI